MPRLLRQRVRCHYCNVASRNVQAGIPRSWLCQHCDAMNHLDESGNITDPPVASPAPTNQFAHPQSTYPDMAPESTFCNACLKNQLIVNDIMAEYLPEEDEPDHKLKLEAAETYRRELEERWPPVCADCIERVQEAIRKSANIARSERLKQILEQSKKNEEQLFLPQQKFKLLIVRVAKWIYICSAVVGLLWHTIGALATENGSAASLEHVDPKMCFEGLLLDRRADPSCVTHPDALYWAKLSIITDLATFWWTPTLRQKIERPFGAIQGLRVLWLVRILIVCLRYGNYSYIVNSPIQTTNTPLYGSHNVLIAGLLLSVLATWRATRLTFKTKGSLSTPIALRLPQAPAQPASTRTALPNATSFDTTAHALNRAIAISGSDVVYNNADLLPSPPSSPRLSDYNDYDDDSPFNMSYERRKIHPADGMDWTPTPRRFAQQYVETLPDIYAPAEPVPPETGLQPQLGSHSIFAKPDPNPFRRRVPAAPQRADQAKRNLWKPKLFQSTPPETQTRFLADIMAKGQISPNERAQLAHTGTPRTVKRDAELFAQPKLKYDHFGYAPQKKTGLEDDFDRLFQ